MPLAWIANAVATSQGSTPGVYDLSEEELEPLLRAGLASRQPPMFGEVPGVASENFRGSWRA
jgi:hypothetical protein